MTPVATMVAALIAALTTPAHGIAPRWVIWRWPIVNAGTAHLVGRAPVARVVVGIIAARDVAVAIGIIGIPIPS
jgi:hypothetical protein